MGGAPWGLLRAVQSCVPPSGGGAGSWTILPKQATFFPHCENCDNNDASIANKVHQDSDHVDDAARGIRKQLYKNAGLRGFTQDLWTREWEGFDSEEIRPFRNGPLWSSGFDTRRVHVDIDCWDIDPWGNPDDWEGHWGFDLVRHGRRVYKDGKDIGAYLNFQAGVAWWDRRHHKGNWYYLRASQDEYIDLEATFGFVQAENRRSSTPDTAAPAKV